MSIEAKNAYLKRWRQTTSGQAYLMASKRREKARRRAVAELIENHEGEFGRLMLKYLAIVEQEYAAEQEQR